MSETASDIPESTSETAPEKSLMEVTLAGAITLVKQGNSYAQATEQFEALLRQVEAESPTAAPLLKQLWQEFISGQRAAAFWETMSDAEKELSDKMSASNIQLKQNYMRLIQEQ